MYEIQHVSRKQGQGDSPHHYSLTQNRCSQMEETGWQEHDGRCGWRQHILIGASLQPNTSDSKGNGPNIVSSLQLKSLR